MEKFYDEIPEMTFFTGDTLPIFTIKVKNQDIAKCTMKMVISRVKPPEEVVIERECLKDKTVEGEDCFLFHLWSEITEKLTAGTYRISFIMTDDMPYEYVKLSGLMHVRSLTEE